MRNWLYSLTPATRGVVVLAGSLFALAGCVVLWPIAQDSWMILLIVGLFVLARMGFSSGVAWLGFSRKLDSDAERTTAEAAPVAVPADPRQLAANAVSRLRSEQAVLRTCLVGDGILMAALVVGILLDYWLQGPIGLAVTMVYVFFVAAALGLVMVAAAIVGRRLLRRREAELSRVACSPPTVDAQ